MYLLDLNIWTVVGVSLVPLLVGGFWYSPTVFGKYWVRMSGVNIRAIRESRRAMAFAFLVSGVASFVMAFVLALLIQNLIVITVFDGILVGFYVWLGFVATITLSEYSITNDHRPYQLYIITNGYYLVTLLVMGALFALLGY